MLKYYGTCAVHRLPIIMEAKKRTTMGNENSQGGACRGQPSRTMHWFNKTSQATSEPRSSKRLRYAGRGKTKRPLLDPIVASS
jgi:hypothetical protein